MIFKDFTPQQLRDAIEVEMKKTNDPKIASITAIKKLKINPKYYLEEMFKAKDIGKLTKKVIINKKGNQQTVYVRTHEEPKESWLNKFAAIFNFKDRKQVIQKIEKDYRDNELDKKYGLTWDGWEDHLAEYFNNKDKWSKFFNKGKGGKITGTGTDNKKEKKPPIQKNKKKGPLKLSVMKLIHNLYGGEIKKEEKPVENNFGTMPDIITDQAEKQKKLNSIAEGELILKTGKINGRKMSKDELTGVLKSVNSSRNKIGLSLRTPEEFGLSDEKPEQETEDKKIAQKKEEKKLDDIIYKKEIESIPEQFKKIIPTKMDLEIVSKGNKYFKVINPGKNFKMDLYINKSSESYKIGDKISINVLKHVESNKYGMKVQIYPISDNEIAEITERAQVEKNKDEMDRWMRYVREAADKGYIYTKGVDKLQQLGIAKVEKLNNELSNIKAKINNKKTIEKIDNYLNYMQEAANKGYVYKNGLQTLKELKIENYPEKQEKLNKILDSIEVKKQEKVDEKIKEKETNKKEGKVYDFHIFVHSYAPVLNVPVKSGDKIIVYEKTGKNFYINAEDEYTFGFFPGGGVAARYYYRDATPNEIKDYEEKQTKVKKEKELRNNFKEIKSKIENLITSQGEWVSPQNNEQIDLEGEKYFNTMDIYGGGSYFLIDKDKKYIWHVRNNGMDGDNWSTNNIRTGGAGAIGHRLKYTEDIKNKFQQMLDANEIINKLNNIKIEKIEKARINFNQNFLINKQSKNIFIKKLNTKTQQFEYRKFNKS